MILRTGWRSTVRFNFTACFTAGDDLLKYLHLEHHVKTVNLVWTRFYRLLFLFSRSSIKSSNHQSSSSSSSSSLSSCSSSSALAQELSQQASALPEAEANSQVDWTYDPNEPRYCICNQVSAERRGLRRALMNLSVLVINDFCFAGFLWRDGRLW